MTHFPFNKHSEAFSAFDNSLILPSYLLEDSPTHAASGEHHPKLFVGNLSWTVTSEQLFAYLGGIGSVVSCEVARNRAGQSKGFGLAVFQSPSAATHAIAVFHDRSMDGRKLVVRRDTDAADRPRGPPKNRGAPPPPSDRVFCGNVPFSATQADFAAKFAGSGAVDAALAVDAAGTSRGYGIVLFASIEDAAGAVARFDGSPLGGRPMRCKFDEKGST